MTIAIIGAGAIGSVVAVYLAKAGEDIVLCRPQRPGRGHTKNGLRVVGARGEETFPVQALARLTVNMIWSFLRSRRRILKKRARITRHF